MIYPLRSMLNYTEISGLLQIQSYFVEIAVALQEKQTASPILVTIIFITVFWEHKWSLSLNISKGNIGQKSHWCTSKQSMVFSVLKLYVGTDNITP